MAKWTIANLSDLSTPFIDIYATPLGFGGCRLDVASAVNPSAWWDGCDVDYLESILPLYAAGRGCNVNVFDPRGLLEGAKVMSVESVYHAMELGRADV